MLFWVLLKAVFSLVSPSTSQVILPVLQTHTKLTRSVFYTKKEYALRIGYLFVSAAIAGSLGGLLAYGIGHMDGVAGLRGWRWIIIIEGIPTFILGIAVWFWLADDPDSAHYLTIAERELIDARMRRQVGHTKSSSQMHKEDVYAGLKDWKIWLFCIGQFGGDTILYGYSTFLPTIIRGLGDWNTAQVQALTIPCYAIGAITYIIVAWFSDRTQRRAVFTVALGLVCTVGYAILVSTAPSGVKYFGCCLAAMGLYVIVGLPLAWLPSNNPRYGKRTVATGLQLTIGNSAGIPAPFVSYSFNFYKISLTLLVVQNIRGSSIHQRSCCVYGFGCHVFTHLSCLLGLVPKTEQEEG